MTIHNKLVRSKILEMLDGKNILYTWHSADKAEYTEKLYEKIVEEAGEFATDRNPEELADLLEVIEVVKALNGWKTEQIEEIRVKKLTELGGFDEPIILEES